ncbi:MAG: ABC transporter ATP-binding protein [Lentisphaeria bacterium]|nr:ABC transporter ATP-binding protein [Lentisphaeria bacterium]MDY0175274.1 ABC transporter ATP-binding protein [Lentisphaeria bacterium]
MSKKRKYVKPQHSSATLIYLRLIKDFARPYWFKLLIGVLSGLIIGGAMGAVLRLMDLGLNAFELGVSAETPAVQSPQHITQESPPPQTLSPDKPALTKTSQAKTAKNKKARLLDNLNALFERFGIDIDLDQEQSLTLPVVILLLSILFGFFVLQALGNLVNKYCLRWVGSRIVTDMRIALFDKLQHQSLAFFSKHDVGQLISRCTNDTNAVENVISSSIPELITAPIFIAVAVQFIIAKTREAQLQSQGLLMILFLPLCILPVFILSGYLKRFEKRVLERISLVTSRMLESFSGIRVIKSFNQEEFELGRFTEVNNQYFRSLRKAIFADVLIQPSMQLAAIALAAIFVLICFHYQVSFATLAVVGYAAQQAYKPIKDLAKINASLQKSAAAAERIFQILDTDTALPLAENPLPLTEFKQEIRFEKVSFSYQENDNLVLRDLDLSLPKGSLIAVVGQTGSGKSTLANLLARFYDPCKGRILIDGKDLRELELESFRNLVGIVSQDTFLFNDSIADNIRYGKRQAPMSEVVAAAQQANADEFIDADPLGYERPVGERGNLLSGGQKQRLAIARAILRNPPILILDEATSALDTVTEHLVQEALNNVMHDRTVLAIAHRLSTIKKADCIVVLEQGRIVEQGSHQQLYELNGNYRRLYDMQFAELQDLKED